MDPKNIPFVNFSNGYKMPIIGLGTFQSQSGEVGRAVKDAIDLGYRHFDTAHLYMNEEEVGKAIKEMIAKGTVKREEIFVTTKLWGTNNREDLVVPACKKSLERLDLGYIDLYLIHCPVGIKEGDELLPFDSDGKLLSTDVDYLEVWRGMEECVRLGLARSIGVSNFNSEQIDRLLGAAKIKPVNNQIECCINLNQRRLIKFCAERNITVTGYCPLGRPGRSDMPSSLDHPKVLEISQKYNKTPAQIAIRYVYQLGAVPIPKSVTKTRIEENIKIFDFELTDDDMKALDAAGNGERITKFTHVIDHKYYPFAVPF